MPEYRVRIVVEGQNKGATAVFQEVNRGAQSASGSLNLLSGATKAFAAGMAVFATAKQIMDFGREGAQIELLRSQLDNLTASIGTTSESLLSKMAAATNGMMSNAQMIHSATQLISLGMANDEDSVVRLANIIARLGWDMQQVILTFANNSKMRLDALGLSVTDVEERAKRLEAQGYNTDKAFDMAVIEAAEAKLRLLGDASETNVGKFARMDAAVENLKTTLQEKLAPALAASAEGLTLLITYQDQVNAMLAEGADATIAAGASWGEYVDRQLEAATIAGKITMMERDATRAAIESRDAVAELTAQYGDLSDEMLLSKVQTGEMSVAELEQIQIHKANAEMLQYWLDKIGLKTQADYESEQATMKAMEDAGPYMSDMIEQWAAISAGTKDATMSQDEFKSGMEQITLWISGPLGKEMESYRQSLADLETQYYDDKAALDKLMGEKPPSWNKDATAEWEQKVADLNERMDETAGKIQEVQDAHDEQTAQIIYNMAKQQLAVSGLSFDEQLKVLNDLATSMGLVDTGTQSADLAIQALVAEAAKTGNVENLAAALEMVKNQALDGKVTTEELALALELLNGKTVDTYIRVITQYNSPVGGGNPRNPHDLDREQDGPVGSFALDPGTFVDQTTGGKSATTTTTANQDIYYVTITDDKAARMFIDDRKRQAVEKANGAARG